MVQVPNENTKYIGVYAGSSPTVPDRSEFVWAKYSGADS